MQRIRWASQRGQSLGCAEGFPRTLGGEALRSYSEHPIALPSRQWMNVTQRTVLEVLLRMQISVLFRRRRYARATPPLLLCPT